MKRILLALVLICSSAFSQQAEYFREKAEMGSANAQVRLVCATKMVIRSSSGS